MKKIGILTYHRVFNFGSLLQTYALQHYLEGKSCNVEVIDYYPSRLQKKELLFHVNPKWRKPFYKMVAHLIPAVISRLLGYKMMDDFLKNYVKLTDKTYETADDLSKNVPVEDIYMNGSDQIWNVDTAGGTVDEVFFMNFLSDNAVRTAYAGSFGKDDFNEDDIKKIGERLEKYRAISVREKSGLSILEKAGIENGKWVLDPTFLLKADEWLKIAKSVRLPEHYVLVYNLNRNPRITELAVKIAGQKNIPTQIAKEYGCGAKVFNRLLHLHGIQYRANNQWVLYAKHQDKGYTANLVFRLHRSDGSAVEKLHTAWTHKGRKFLYHELKRRGILPMAEQEG